MIKIDEFFDNLEEFKDTFSCYFEIDDLREVWWKISDCEREVQWWEDKPEYDNEYDEYDEAEYSGELYGTSIFRHENYTTITYDDGCGNRVSGFFSNDKEIKCK